MVHVSRAKLPRNSERCVNLNPCDKSFCCGREDTALRAGIVDCLDLVQ